MKMFFNKNACRIAVIFLLCTILCLSAVSATEYVLNATSIEGFKNGIIYNEDEPLVIVISDDVTITAGGNAAIESAAPVTIRSPTDKTLAIFVNSTEQKIYGIKAPFVDLESGTLDITVTGENDPASGNAFGICAHSGNVTISGGSVLTDIGTTGHKNKGIFAQRYIVISDGRIDAWEHGGLNTFGLDGGDVEVENSTGGVIISGGYIVLNSSGGTVRNFGIDSKFGTVSITGNPVIFIHEDESGSKENLAYRPDITSISGGNAVVFASEGGNYTLREDAVLARTSSLLPGVTFEIPSGKTLGISERTYLTKPADTTLLFGDGFGTFAFARTIPGEDRAAVYTGEEPTPHASFPVTVLFAGLGAVALVLARRR